MKGAFEVDGHSIMLTFENGRVSNLFFASDGIAL